ncbi:MAG TPA: hemerythrin domain-containing protein [Sphingomicrobium sp.]|nr:hemerythrin domain-containing protein [Sphingomicrobium sp.]
MEEIEMATTKTRASTRSTNGSTGKRASARRSPGKAAERPETGREDSAFSWGRNGGGALVGAALAGAAFGLAANFGRKLLMQGMAASAGDWDELLASEHDAVMAIFDRMLATDSTQSFKRSMLLMKLTHALDKHAHEEEMVVYPALREANEAHDADALEGEHGYVKTFIYELNQLGTDAPNWLEKVREFRALVSKHAHMEEEEVFPRFKKALSEEQNAKITSLVNRDGFWQS